MEVQAVRPEINLLSTFEDVASFAIIAQEKLKSVRAEISAIKRLGLAQDVLKQKTVEAQQLAEVKTRAEMKLGELTASMPKASGKRNDLTSSSRGEEVSKPTKAEALEKANINRNQASQYELMAANPDIVEQVIAEAKANDDIVSRSAVMEKIKEKKQAKKKQERKADIERQAKELFCLEVQNAKEEIRARSSKMTLENS